MSTFTVGMNYWPASTAMRMWLRLPTDEIARDFQRIAGAGCGSVRVFLRWEDFQPDPASVDARALADLVRVAELAADASLRIVPTLFTGHMSGANWLPAWATRPGPRGRFPVVVGDAYAEVVPRVWFTDEEVMGAQSLLAREAAVALRGHPALDAWDLGNENSNVCVPETREQARAWLRRMGAALRSGDPACRVTVGLHMEDLEQDRRLGPAEAAEVCDVLCMHGYPLYAPWARPGDPALPAFLAAVTRWLGGKDVFFEEFGMPASTEEDEERSDLFIGTALDALHGAGAAGAMVWCYADYSPAIWGLPPLDRAPHERCFGLWRADGTAKPAVRQLSRYRGVARRPAPERMEWIDLDRSRYYEAPLDNLVHLYERFSRVAATR